MIEDPLGCVEYDESGQGPSLLLVPGSCSTGSAWKAVTAGLAGRYRTITTSLPGYGGTAERRTGADRSIALVAEALDWKSAYAAAYDPRVLAELKLPVLVAVGGRSHPAVKEANSLIARAIPGAAFATIEGASHFMIATHPREVAILIAGHVSR